MVVKAPIKIGNNGCFQSIISEADREKDGKSLTFYNRQVNPNIKLT